MRRQRRPPSSAAADHPLETGFGWWVVLAAGFTLLTLNPAARFPTAYGFAAIIFVSLALAGPARRFLRGRRLRRQGLLRAIATLGDEALLAVTQLEGAVVHRERVGVGDLDDAPRVILAPRGASPQALRRAQSMGIRILTPMGIMLHLEWLGIRTESSLLSKAPPTPPACPTCGSVMELKHSRRPGELDRSFWGCTKFPGCRGTRNIVRRM